MEFKDTIQSFNVLDNDAVEGIRSCLNFSTGQTWNLLIGQLRREASGRLLERSRISTSAEELREFLSKPFKIADLYSWLNERS